MRRMLLATRRLVLGTHPWLSAGVIAAAVATAALQASGFDGWWVLPAALAVLWTAGISVRNDR